MSNFSALSPLDFEILIQDLLSVEYDQKFESFTPGRDGGIDLRLISQGRIGNTTTIVQCKHYEKSGYSNLLSKLRKERIQASKLKSDRYILVTSVGLTPARKHEIQEVMGGIIRCDSDVLGVDDVQQLIRRHPDVEKSHFKLWLHSTAVLQRIMHNGVINRSEEDLRQMIDRANIFVAGKSVEEAHKRLAQSHVCIVTGAPGVGKTTLCQILLLDYSNRGYSPIIVGRNIDEAFQLFDPGKKQIFLYDDFLGRTTSQDKLEKNEDSDLIRFIRMVSEHGNTLFLLTTRDYLYYQAQHRYENMNTGAIETNRMVLALDDYSRANRAKILFNHLYYSNLSAGQRAAIVKSKKYVNMIDTKHYNPRSIETAVKFIDKQDIDPEEVPNFLLKTIEEPEELWSHVLTKEINFGQKMCLAVIVLHGSRMFVDTLERVFMQGMSAIQEDYDFDACLEILEGTAIKIVTTPGGSSSVSLYNPGIEDVVLEFVLGNSLVMSKLPHFVGSVEVLVQLWNYANAIKDQSDRIAYRWHTSNRRSTLTSERNTKYPKLNKRLRLNIKSFLDKSCPYVGIDSSGLLYVGVSTAEQLSMILRIAEECSASINPNILNASLKRVLDQIRHYSYFDRDDVANRAFSSKDDAWGLIKSINFYMDSFGRSSLLLDLRRAALDFVIGGPIESVEDWEALSNLVDMDYEDDTWLEDYTNFRFGNAELKEILHKEMPGFVHRYSRDHDLAEADYDVETLEGFISGLGHDPDEFLQELWDDVENAKNSYHPDDEYVESDNVVHSDPEDSGSDVDRMFENLLD